MESLGEILRGMMLKRQSNGPQESRPNDSPPLVMCPQCHGVGFVIPKGEGKHIAYGNASVEIIGCPACNPPKPIGQGRSFAGFEVIPGTETMIEAAKDFAARVGPPGLTITGIPGSGKTHVLEAIANAMLRAASVPSYIFVPDFLDRLRSTFEPESDWRYQDLWDRWANADVLLMDDLKDDGRPTAWAVGQIERIIDMRYREGKAYAVTTNGTLTSIASSWGRRLADRLFDERSGMVRVVYNTALSYRTGRG